MCKLFFISAFAILLFGCAIDTIEKQSFALKDESKPTKPISIPENFYTKYRGVYENSIFGFSAKIPDNLEGESSPPPLPQHGFKIEISNDSTIYVSGNYNALLWKSLDEAVKNERDDFDNTQKIVEFKTRYIKLDGLKFVEITTKYLDKDNKAKADDTFIGLTKRTEEEAEIFYELNLETSAERFSEDRKVFEEIINSWKKIPIEN